MALGAFVFGAFAAWFWASKTRPSDTRDWLAILEQFRRSWGQQWWLCYHKLKFDDHLRDEEIVARFLCSISGEMGLQPNSDIVCRFGFRKVAIQALAAVGPLPESELWAIAAKIDRDANSRRSLGALRS